MKWCKELERSEKIRNYPKAAVHMALTYALVAFENPSELYPDLIQGFIYNLERLLDTSEGTFDEFYKCF